MRLVLEVVSGPAAGRKIRLEAGHGARFGRTEWADYSFPQDGMMSGVHFAVQNEDRAAYIQDLKSSNGTFVNGQQISARTVLKPGDEILAGATAFVAQLEGEALGADRPPMPDYTAVHPAAPPNIYPAPAAEPPHVSSAASVPGGAGHWSFTTEKCTSGLALCRGDTAEIPPQQVATLLCQVYPVYLIVDFRNLGSPPPSELGPREFLFDWLEPQVAALASPVVISQTDLLAWPDLVAQGWGRDAVIGVFSKRDKPALLAHLRQVIRAKPKREDLHGGIVGYCWPSIMAMLLAHGKPDFVERLLEGIETVMVELPDLPETWQLFGGPQLQNTLTDIGFVHRT